MPGSPATVRGFSFAAEPAGDATGDQQDHQPAFEHGASEHPGRRGETIGGGAVGLAAFVEAGLTARSLIGGVTLRLGLPREARQKNPYPQVFHAETSSMLSAE